MNAGHHANIQPHWCVMFSRIIDLCGIINTKLLSAFDVKNLILFKEQLVLPPPKCKKTHVCLKINIYTYIHVWCIFLHIDLNHMVLWVRLLLQIIVLLE